MAFDNPALSHFTDTFISLNFLQTPSRKSCHDCFLFRGMSPENMSLGHTVQAVVGNVKVYRLTLTVGLYDSLTMTVPLSQLVM